MRCKLRRSWLIEPLQLTESWDRGRIEWLFKDNIELSFEHIQGKSRNIKSSETASCRRDLADFISRYLIEEVEVKAHTGCDYRCSSSVHCYINEGHGWGGARGVLALWDHFQPTFWSMLICQRLDQAVLTHDILLKIWGSNPFDDAETSEDAYDYEMNLRTRRIFVCGEWERRIEGLGIPERRAERFKKWLSWFLQLTMSISLCWRSQNVRRNMYGIQGQNKLNERTGLVHTDWLARSRLW